MKKNNRTKTHVSNRVQEESEIESMQLAEAIRKAEAGNPEVALAAMRKLDIPSDALRNARGVCLLRAGRYQEALSLFRSLVLMPGCTWMKREAPVIYRTNFCTALFLAGHPVGCVNCLVEIEEKTHPSVKRLQQAVDRWEQNLPWWSWLQWKLGLEPDSPMELDFVPGEFADTSDEPPRTTPLDERIGRAA